MFNVKSILSILILSSSAFGYASLPGSSHSLYVNFNGESNDLQTVSAYDGSQQDKLNILTGVASIYNHPIVRHVDGRIEEMPGLNINITDVAPNYNTLGAGASEIALGDPADGTTGSSGYAYVNSFFGNYSLFAIGYSFPKNAGNTVENIIDSISHESGHQLGLSHQSDFDSNGNLVNVYSAGADGVSPIMGYFYNGPSYWWEGLNQDGVFQNDYAILASQLGTVAVPEPSFLALIVSTYFISLRKRLK